MKKLFLSIAILAATFANKNTFANDGMHVVSLDNLNGNLYVRVMDGLKFKITLDNLQSNSKLEITNQIGEIIHTEILANTDTQVKIFDLSTLPNGIYNFTVFTGKEKTTKSVKIMTETVAKVLSI